MLVGLETGDDAGVFRLDSKRALVQTVDFFTPIVDDPFQYGEIAAANSLSDVYAMGGRPLTALNIIGMPEEKVPPSVIAKILDGGLSKMREAGCVLVGGHSIRNPEPIYGLSVTGLVSPRTFISNARGRAGDQLFLTKPLGTGIATTAIKRNLSSVALQTVAIDWMCQLNSFGAVAAEKRMVRAGTDITGFGFLGHLLSLCRASRVRAEIDSPAVPAFSPEIFDLIAADCVPGGSRQNLKQSRGLVGWEKVAEETKILLADAQTSGGLLLCVPKKMVSRFQKIADQNDQPCWRVGQLAAGSPGIIVRK